MTKTVLFDMDGVLIDATEWHYEALNESLEIFGFSIPRDEHLNRFNGMTTRSKLEILSEEKNLPRGLHDIISDIKQDRTLRIAARMCFPNASHLILLSSLKERNGCLVRLVRTPPPQPSSKGKDQNEQILDEEKFN